MRRAVLLTLGAIVLLVVATLVYGTTRPRDHVATSSVTIPQPIDSVWGVVRDPGSLVGIWPELTRASRLEDPAGRELWEEFVDGFEMRLHVSEATAPIRMVTTVDAAPDAAFGGQWIYQLEPVEGGTRLTVTEAGWIGNPFFRAMGHLFGLHHSIEGYLRAVGRRFGVEVEPVRVG